MPCFWVLIYFDALVEGISLATGEQVVIDLKWSPEPRTLFKKVIGG
jgi:hypothetical protein